MTGELSALGATAKPERRDGSQDEVLCAARVQRGERVPRLVHSQQASGAAVAKNIWEITRGGRNGPVDELAPAAEWLLTRLSAAAAAVHGIPARRRELGCLAANNRDGDGAVDIPRVASLYRACFHCRVTLPLTGLREWCCCSAVSPHARASPRPEPVTKPRGLLRCLRPHGKVRALPRAANPQTRRSLPCLSLYRKLERSGALSRILYSQPSRPGNRRDVVAVTE